MEPEGTIQMNDQRCIVSAQTASITEKQQHMYMDSYRARRSIFRVAHLLRTAETPLCHEELRVQWKVKGDQQEMRAALIVWVETKPVQIPKVLRPTVSRKFMEMGYEHTFNCGTTVMALQDWNHLRGPSRF